MRDLIEGIIISEKSYSETSKIINILTKDYGIIGCIAKGAKGLKSNLRVGTMKMTYGYFSMNYREDKLSVLTNVDVIDNLNFIRKDIMRTSYASYIIELADQVMRQNKESIVYGLLIQSLLKINEGYDSQVIVNILELKYLEFLGVMPILDACSMCGSKVSIATICGSRGGYVCTKCLTNEKIVSEKTIKLIRMFYYLDISKIDKLDISLEIKKEIDEFLDEYYELYTGLYLKTKQFLKKINKVG